MSGKRAERWQRCFDRLVMDRFRGRKPWLRATPRCPLDDFLSPGVVAFWRTRLHARFRQCRADTKRAITGELGRVSAPAELMGKIRAPVDMARALIADFNTCLRLRPVVALKRLNRASFKEHTAER